MEKAQNAGSSPLLNNRIVSLLRRSGNLPRTVIFLAVGIILLFFGFFGGSGGETESAQPESEEERLESICSSVAGVGECRVMISYTAAARETERRVESVCIVCRGGSSVKVRERLCSLISSLYGIGTNRIYIATLG